ncbi:nitrite reductase [Desulfitobacterium sp. AusDCA]|uniref:nitrite reductase n=1 Tax=Desulfitobacterium sp. AusDCA TaxID=3240383 RepID=UPI003DA6EBC4
MNFTKASAFKAYRKMDKACYLDCNCTPVCQLYMAKEILSKSVETGNKTAENMPEDILDMFKSIPIVSERYNQMELHDAFEAVQSICDNCPSFVHSKYCVVNVVLSALGTLVYGKNFVTEKDAEAQRTK